MNNIRMVKGDDGSIFLSQEDLLTVMATRLDKFPDELDELRKPKGSALVGPGGKSNLTPPNPSAIAHHEGMQKMLEGLMSIINITDEDEK